MDLQVFRNAEFGSVRAVEMNGTPFFVGKDVAEILGYSRPDHAISNHIDEEDKLMYQIDTSGQKRQMFIINESGLYSLILSSKQPTAKRFKRWVTNEVLPSIRCDGGYTAKPSNQLTFDQTLAIVQVIKDTPLETMEYVFAALKVFVPNLSLPRSAPAPQQTEREVLNIADTLKAYMKKHHITYQEFALHTGFSQTSIRAWASGKQKPSVPSMQVLTYIMDEDIGSYYWKTNGTLETLCR